MDRPITTNDEAVLRDELVRADLALSGVAPVLAHMLVQSEAPHVTEAILAQVQGMLHDMSRQLIENAASPDSPFDPVEMDQNIDALIERLAEDQHILRFCYVAAVEGRLAERFQQSHSIDPVLTPLLQELIASEEPESAELAMTTLAAQSRFMQHYQRMAMPLTELPADLFDAVLAMWQDFSQHNRIALTLQSLEDLRRSYDEAATRSALLERLASSMGRAEVVGLDVKHAGFALFATVLGRISGQARGLAVLSCLTDQYARFALGLRAGGHAESDIAVLFEIFHPERPVPSGLDQILPDQAQSIIRHSDAGNGR